MSQYDVTVIGAGITGLTAGLTAAQLGCKTLIVGEALGGQLIKIDKVESYPGHPEGVPGYDLCPMAQEQAEAAGAEFINGTCEQVAKDGGDWACAWTVRMSHRRR